MKATFDPKAKIKCSRSHNKETPCIFSGFSVIDCDNVLEPLRMASDKRARQFITVKLFKTRKAAYCVLYVLWSAGGSVTSSGRATGCGYHRASAALAEAISNAGFTLSESISGVGDSAMRNALLAIAKAAGCRSPQIVEANP